MHTFRKAALIAFLLTAGLVASTRAADQPTTEIFLPVVARSFAAIPPAAPGNLQVVVNGHTAHLSWLDSSEKESSFVVEAVPSDGTGPLSSTEATGATSSVIELPSAGEWVFTVWARNDHGLSGPSNAAHGTVSPAILKVSNQSGLSILSLRIDGETQPLPLDTYGHANILPGAAADFSLSTWEHSYTLELGLSGTTQAVIYGANGELFGHISAFPEEQNEVVVLHPPVTSVLTGFSQAGAWAGLVHTGEEAYTSVYCFYPDGRFMEWNVSETPFTIVDQGTYTGQPADLYISIGLHGLSEMHAEYDEIQKWFTVTEKQESQYQGAPGYTDFCLASAP
jgi:hypothetical protein